MSVTTVQSTLAKIVLNDSVLPSAIALRQLHWFPVKQRNHFEIGTLIYRTLQSGSPFYLSSLINFYNSSRPLHSSSLNLLHVSFKPLVAKLYGLQLQQFGILFHKTSGYYHLSVLLNALSKLSLFLFQLAMFPTSLHQRL